MPVIEDVPVVTSTQRLLNIRSYYAAGKYKHGAYALLKDKRICTITGHRAGREITLNLMDNGKIITLPYNDPSIVIISNELELLNKWNDFNDGQLSCYFCKHHNEFVFGTGHYHQYQCPVCKNGTKDY